MSDFKPADTVPGFRAETVTIGGVASITAAAATRTAGPCSSGMASSRLATPGAR